MSRCPASESRILSFWASTAPRTRRTSLRSRVERQRPSAVQTIASSTHPRSPSAMPRLTSPSRNPAWPPAPGDNGRSPRRAVRVEPERWQGCCWLPDSRARFSRLSGNAPSPRRDRPLRARARPRLLWALAIVGLDLQCLFENWGSLHPAGPSPDSSAEVEIYRTARGVTVRVCFHSVSLLCQKDVCRHAQPIRPPPRSPPKRRIASGEGAKSGRGRDAPGQGDARPDQRQIRVAVGHCLLAHLHQSDHRHEHPQIPKPADQQIGALPPHDPGAAEMPISASKAPTIFQIGKVS